MSVFTPEQVVSLNEYQQAGDLHPFTCGSGNRTDEHHLDGEGILVATEDGWRCPYCDYTQDWAHDWMKDGSWKVYQRVLDGLIDAVLDAEPEAE